MSAATQASGRVVFAAPVLVAFVITGRQWLGVPGGIVVRKGTWLKRRWSLRLFDRRESILVVYSL